MKKWILLFSIFPLSLLANQVSLVLKDAPTAEVVAYLASEMDKNIVLHQDIESKSNIRIENSQFDAILKSIAKINKLNIQQENGVYYISEKTKEDLNEKIKPLDVKNHQNQETKRIWDLAGKNGIKWAGIIENRGFAVHCPFFILRERKLRKNQIFG